MKKIPPFVHRIILYALIAGFSMSSALAQVNTESLRKKLDQPGLYGDLSTSFSIRQGNQEVLQSRLKGRFDHLSTLGHTFLVAEHRISRKDGDIYIDQGFLHGRFIRSITTEIAAEIFLQREYNAFIRLSDRTLIGSGLRLSLRKGSEEHPLSLTLGLGLMQENEEYKLADDGRGADPIHGASASLTRSTNYLVAGWNSGKRIALQSTQYAQVDIQRLTDIRILSQSTLEVKLWDQLALQLTLDLRYDSEPPLGIERTDLELQQGFKYSFP